MIFTQALALLAFNMVGLNCSPSDTAADIKKIVDSFRVADAVKRIEIKEDLSKRIFDANLDTDRAWLQETANEMADIRKTSSSWHQRVLANDIQDLALRRLAGEPFPRFQSEYVVTYLKPGQQGSAFDENSFKWKPMATDHAKLFDAVKTKLKDEKPIPVKIGNKNLLVYGYTGVTKNQNITGLLLVDPQTHDFYKMTFEIEPHTKTKILLLRQTSDATKRSIVTELQVGSPKGQSDFVSQRADVLIHPDEMKAMATRQENQGADEKR